MASGLVKDISWDPVRGGEAFESCVPRPTGTGLEHGDVCSERILSAAVRKTCLVVFSEMSLSAAAPEDVPDTYFVGVGVSEHRQSVVRGSLAPLRGRLSEKVASV